MPDDNKFEKLRAIGYRIPGCCGFCKDGDFGPQAHWGTCKKHRYQHKKHNNPDQGRGVSIHVSGTCDDFRVECGRLARVGLVPGLAAHMEFFDGGATNGS